MPSSVATSGSTAVERCAIDLTGNTEELRSCDCTYRTCYRPFLLPLSSTLFRGPSAAERRGLTAGMSSGMRCSSPGAQLRADLKRRDRWTIGTDDTCGPPSGALGGHLARCIPGSRAATEASESAAAPRSTVRAVGLPIPVIAPITSVQRLPTTRGTTTK